MRRADNRVAAITKRIRVCPNARNVDVEYEGDTPTWWIDLPPGFTFEDCHQIHAYSEREAMYALDSLEPCDCDGCVDEAREELPRSDV